MRGITQRAISFGAVILLLAVPTLMAQARQTSVDDAAFGRSFRSESRQVEQVRLHYVTGGSGDVVVLLHGWPQTWFEWREMMPTLSTSYRVIAVDLPGLGDSGPAPSYDKKRVAQHVHAFINDLKIARVHLVGHDMGGIVAYAYARQYPDDVNTLTIVDTPIPGLTGWDELQRQAPRWHWLLHNIPDLPEALISGKEKVYLTWFYQNFGFNKAVFSEDRIDRYVRSYSKPTSLHAGFEYYRAFEKDAIDNKGYDSHKLPMPVLALGGEKSRLNQYVIDQLRQATTQLTGDLVPESGHWVPEEQPVWLAKRLMEFFAKH